jgi:hypothetical protein
LDETNDDIQTFYRVLYVEAGEKGKSAMFRCKTTIFKSENVSYISNPRWLMNTFNFEMVLPNTFAKGKKIPDISLLNGEILVALYCTRPGSGNDFLGQISIDLAKLIRHGTIIPYEEDDDKEIQIREDKGLFSLKNRTGDIDPSGAELKAEFRIRWNGASIKIPKSKTAATKNKLNNKISPAELQAEKARKAQCSSGYGKVMKTAKDLNRGAQWEAYKRIAQGRLDFHNEIFVKRLLRDAKGREMTEQEKSVLAAYDKVNKPKSKKDKKSPSRKKGWNDRIDITPLEEENRKRAAVLEDHKIPLSARGEHTKIMKEKQKNKQTLAELILQKDQLKAEVTSLTTESKDLKATKLRLESTLKRYETTVKRSKDGEANALKQGSIIKSNNNAFVDIDLDSITNYQLKDMAVEHLSLQAIRKAIVDRKDKAQKEINAIEDNLKNMKERQIRAWERLGNFEAEQNEGKDDGKNEDEAWLGHKAMETLERERDECERLIIQREEKLHLGEIEDEVEELLAVKSMLKSRVTTFEKNISKYQYEKDLFMERFDGMASDDMTGLLRDGLKRMRWERSRRRRVGKLFSIIDSTNDMELELLKFKLDQSKATIANGTQKKNLDRNIVEMTRRDSISIDQLLKSNEPSSPRSQKFVDEVRRGSISIDQLLKSNEPSSPRTQKIVDQVRRGSISIDQLLKNND